jgi:hypothetical protein
MSELLDLADSDGDARWIGIRRHQAVLVVSGMSLIGDSVVRPGGVLLEAVAGSVMLLCSLPVYDNLTIGELLAVGLRFLGRSRWTFLSVAVHGRTLKLSARGQVMVQGYELQHRGRLDLSGRDVQGAQELAAFADALSTGDGSGHASVHVRSNSVHARTLLSLREGVRAPEAWSANSALVRDFLGLAGVQDSMWLLERWRYVRTSGGVARVLRIRDFSAVPSGQALLERLQQSGGEVSVAMHFDVVGGAKAHRIAERAVHRVGSDGALSRAAGFRRTARADRGLERLVQREALVASGRALLRVGVYVSVHGLTQDELRRSLDAVLAKAHEAGLRCERGLGRQAIWFCYQLPGGPGW